MSTKAKAVATKSPKASKASKAAKSAPAKAAKVAAKPAKAAAASKKAAAAAKPAKEVKEAKAPKAAKKGKGKNAEDDVVKAASENGEPQVDQDELDEQEDEAAASRSSGGGNAAALAAAGSGEMSASFKNFRHHPDMENFYRFIYDNDLRVEALQIIDQIMVEKAAKKASKGGKAAH